MEKPRYELGTSLDVEERSLGSYILALNFDGNDLRNARRILDLGSSRTERFTAELRKYDIKTQIVSLNPDCVLEPCRQELVSSTGWERRTVAGIGQELPFSNESFDLVLAVNSLSHFAKPSDSNIDTVMWLSELSRVLAPLGRALIGPAYGTTVAIEEQYKSCLSSELIQHIELEVEPILDTNNNPVITNDDTGRHLQRLVVNKSDSC